MFTHQADGTIVVGRTRIPLDLFRLLEPQYQLPPDCYSMTYDPSSGRVYDRDSSQGSRYTVHGAWEDGDRFIAREAEFAAMVETDRIETMMARRDAAAAIAERTSYADLRKGEYPSHGELVVALWEMVMENDLRKAYTLQRLREQIKAKYPKEPTQCQQSTPAGNSSTTA